MLDTGTKRRIDTARDILVGKVPDPKSQVEQITIALIYKFMDDMDAESEEMGGKRKFFAKEFARYGWAKLMRSGLGGHETLNLYAEAIARMPENPGIPPLFRDIFKNAYLPYRDPETLRAFLKIIDEFTYDHSERLGDAFEYLLSVLGSQGDAGQFRTPRHIIDFIVEAIDPKKNESVLDPACGTAGFLISAYKHILKNNSEELRMTNDKLRIENNGSPPSVIRNSQFVTNLTPDDKGRLAKNFKGYDISPDMVRLSLVNLYLHGFTDPHIYEYDTLTSQEKWNECADVVLANPPFMSPKGGIKPHNRFSVQSKRSEVLFVDYMAEHLTPKGRAGIIVPEGIIFTNHTAYKQLRKMLMENSLVAVVSLPAGVFNPYSPVKTSILILDKVLAKRSDSIAFFKVENDGFGLGAQRRPIEKNDLPAATNFLKSWFQSLRSTASTLSTLSIPNGLIVEKAKIAANGEYNLSGERYRENGVLDHVFPLVRIGDVCTINPRKSQLTDVATDTRISFVPMTDLNEHCMAFKPREEKRLSEVGASYTYFEDNDVLLAKVTPCFENGKAGIARGLLNGIGFGSSEFYVLRPNDLVLPEWIYFCVMHPSFRDAAVAQMTGTGGLQRVPKSYVEGFQIPLPPLEVQKEIVSEIEGYQKVIDGARAVLDNYRPHIPIHLEWPMVELGEVCFLFGGGTPSKQRKEYWSGGKIKWISSKHINEEGKITGYETITKEAVNSSSTKVIPKGSTVAITRVSVGKIAFADDDYAINQDLTGLTSKNTAQLNESFLFYSTRRLGAVIDKNAQGIGVRGVTRDFLSKLKIPLPPLATQKAIVAEIEAEQAIVSANRELISRFEKKIQTTLARVWEES
ncbi:MAG: N-6 DNA methylase [Nitrospinae bacterium]|nr:N-6 DNA methylase [Nitrospinota bacterium]